MFGNSDCLTSKPSFASGLSAADRSIHGCKKPPEDLLPGALLELFSFAGVLLRTAESITHPPESVLRPRDS